MSEGFYVEECRELERALKDLTQNAIQNYFVVLAQDGEALKRLEGERRRTAERTSCQETNTPALLGYFTVLLWGIKAFGRPDTRLLRDLFAILWWRAAMSPRSKWTVLCWESIRWQQNSPRIWSFI